MVAPKNKRKIRKVMFWTRPQRHARQAKTLRKPSLAEANRTAAFGQVAGKNISP